MNVDTKIISLSPDEWYLYKQIRLEALKNEPQAFGSSYTDALEKEESQWRERLNNKETDMVLFAKHGDVIVGMIGAYCNKSSLPKNTARIWGVYVSNEYRGKGIGKQLMHAIVEELKKDVGIKKVVLDVNKDQTSAVALYKKLGFIVTGSEHVTLGDDNLHEDYHMEINI